MQAVVQNIIDALSLGSLFALTSLGIGLIFGIMRLINFAHGDLIMIGAYALIVPSAAVAPQLFIGAWHPAAAVAAIVLIVILFAVACERLAFRPLRRADPSVLLIASFALSFFLQNLILLIYEGRPKGVDLWPVLTDPFLLGDIRLPRLQIVMIAATAALLLLLVLFLKRTAIGRQMRAASEDFMMARFLGVRANRVIAAAFAISGLLAAVISLLFVVQNGVLKFDMGVPLVLAAFVGTVVGGMGSLAGAVVGGFVVGVASVFFQIVLPLEMRLNRDAWVYGLILVILLLRPGGIVKVKAVEERI